MIALRTTRVLREHAAGGEYDVEYTIVRTASFYLELTRRRFVYAG